MGRSFGEKVLMSLSSHSRVYVSLKRQTCANNWPRRQLSLRLQYERRLGSQKPIREVHTLQPSFAISGISVFTAHHDPCQNVQMVSNETKIVNLSLNLESILDENRTDESDIASTKIKRFSLFIISQAPENCNDFHLFNLTIERRIKIKKNLTTEYCASDENLIDVFLTNNGYRVLYWFSSNATRCFDPSAQMMAKDLLFHIITTAITIN